MAKVTLTKKASPSFSSTVTVNGVPLPSFTDRLAYRNDLLLPLEATDRLGHYDLVASVHGGGSTGQVGAVRLGLSRCLEKAEPGLRPVLKGGGMLTRDSRVVERKKYGRHKARKSKQWVKR